MSAAPTKFRTAFVTGASQGIGRAIALRLADDGLDVAVNDLPSKLEQLKAVVAEIEAKGRKGHAVTGDVSNEEQVRANVEEAVQVLGSLDVMVANAGIGGPPAATKDADLAVWDQVLNVNLKGAVLSYKYAAQQMLKQGTPGRIIGASSLFGKRAGAFMGPYCASKFAIRGLTQSTALELRGSGITVNAYAPGLINTPLISSAEYDVEGEEGLENVKKLFNLPEATIGVPENVAALVSYLASPGAQFMTGQSITLDGGLYFD